MNETAKDQIVGDTEELAKFESLADQWWDAEGPLKTLHDINPLRLDYINARVPLEGARVLDVGCGGGILSEAMAQRGADVVGIDWRLPLSDARRILGPETAVQGNLDPAALFSPREELARQIDQVLEDAGEAPGHIFNLGHGIERTTDPDAVAFLVDRVHEATERA